MVEQKYNEIVMLVHPLYDVFFTHEFNYILRKTTIKDNRLVFDKSLLKKDVDLFKKQISVSLAVYRKTIKERDKGNNFFILNELCVDKTFIDSIPERKDMYDLVMRPLKEYIEKKFKNRFFVFYNQVSSAEALEERESNFLKLKKKLASEIKLIGFGEYANKDRCVNQSMNYVSEKITKKESNLDKPIKIISKKKLYTRSLSYPGTKETLLNFRHRIITPEQQKARTRRRILKNKILNTFKIK